MTGKSRNVLLCKLVRCSQAFAQGLWNNGTLSPYLFLLSHNSKTVRFVSVFSYVSVKCLAWRGG